MNSAKHTGLFLIAILLFFGCKSSQPLSNKTKHLVRLIEKPEPFNNGFTGFALYDPGSKRMIWQQYADKHFTPASNTKILTLYAALNILDSNALAGLHYSSQPDHTLFRGSGHPALLHQTFTDSTQSTFQFLKQHDKPLVFCDCNFHDHRYGSGWSWDDYHYYYQTEKSPLPIYGNTVRFEKSGRNTQMVVEPPFFRSLLSEKPNLKSKSIYRSWDNNDFEYSQNQPGIRSAERPFRTSPPTVIALLQDTLHRPIDYCRGNCENMLFETVLSEVSANEIYQQLMLPSDNFVAEQLLLMCADQLSDSLQVDIAIDWAMKNLFQDLSDTPRWVDGSGLSRYNQLTPRVLIEVLDKLYQQLPEEQLFDIFPKGGVNGTIKDWYGGLGHPYVFAKTGTLRHVHCLSGYIKTASGRTLIFSFMHNNHTQPSRKLKLQMEMVLRYIYSRY